MNYPTQPERLTTRTLAPDERRDCIEHQFKNATAFVVSGKRLERPPKPMTWTDATPSDELLSAASELLKLLRNSYRDDATAAAFERLESAVNAVTASKITPSPAGSWRKAGGVLSKSQGQQQ